MIYLDNLEQRKGHVARSMQATVIDKECVVPYLGIIYQLLLEL